nr:VWA domain-containing protein [Chitinophagaceae bacterium]
SVHVISTDSTPIIDALVKLKREGNTIFIAKTDNKGKAELWADLFQNNSNTDFSKLLIEINNGSNIILTVKPYKDGINKVVMSPITIDNKIELSFVVDATGSMGDELEYLKTELLDVISRVKSANPNSTVLTSSVFYRDEGDDYVTRVSNFTTNNSVTTNFIKNQSSGGGGDFPEAVHSALDKAVNELQWSTKAKTRLMFLVLDAPPHYNNEVIANIQKSIAKAAEKGIKIIPITASGIDKKTEFLMRFFSISTNGTYVFITNHSGIGNNHLEPTVGQYQVEFLNNLMVRLINKYAE